MRWIHRDVDRRLDLLVALCGDQSRHEGRTPTFEASPHNLDVEPLVRLVHRDLETRCHPAEAKPIAFEHPLRSKRRGTPRCSGPPGGMTSLKASDAF